MRVLMRLVVKEIQQLLRDRKMIPFLVVAPLVQILVFGFAANLDVKEIRLLLLDRERSAASRALTDRFAASGWFDVVGAVADDAEIDDWLTEGRAELALVIHERFGADLAAGRAPRVQVIADGTDSTSAVVGLGYASRIVAEAGADIAVQRARTTATGARGMSRALAAGKVELVPRVWYNPDLKSRWFYLPAILAMVLLMTTLILPSMAVVREREIGTLEQLIVTPIRPWQLMVGKLLPFAAFGLLQVVLLAGFIVVFFGVRLAGSLALLVLLSAPFLLTLLAAGLLISTLASNQQQAMMATMFLAMVPMIYLSGLIFPVENMPRALQWVSFAVPLRYYTNIIRGVFLRGSGWSVLWIDGVVLLGFGLALLALASLRFRKTLD